ncbi:MAG: hypothetical protein HC799_09135 [Limnothrix sp. RL_2_0]|nr:hypothetical protein [Limnothrix sp. RL_2_0]
MSKKSGDLPHQSDEPAALDRLGQRLQKQQIRTVRAPDNMPKMSGVFIDFISPYQDFLAEPEDRDEFISIAVTAWNISLAPRKHRKKLVHGFAETMLEEDEDTPADVLKAMRILLNELMTEKLKYFAEDTRFITDYELTNAEKWQDCRLAIAFELSK